MSDEKEFQELEKKRAGVIRGLNERFAEPNAVPPPVETGTHTADHSPLNAEEHAGRERCVTSLAESIEKLWPKMNAKRALLRVHLRAAWNRQECDEDLSSVTEATDPDHSPSAAELIEEKAALYERGVALDWAEGDSEGAIIGEGVLEMLKDLAKKVREADHSRRAEMPLTIELEREDDGRWIADVPKYPGVTVYGATRSEAVVRALILLEKVEAQASPEPRPAPPPLEENAVWPQENQVLRPIITEGEKP